MLSRKFTYLFGHIGPSSGIYNDLRKYYTVLQWYIAREGCMSEIPHYSIAIYANHYIYLMMALGCQNMSVNLRESMD
jgi:hypothetical protein